MTDPRHAAAPGVATRGGAQNEAGQATTTIPPTSGERPDPRAYLDGYTCGEAVGEARGRIMGHREGYAAGHADGRAEALAEVDEAAREHFGTANRQLVDQLVRTPPWDALADRRGQHERAQRQRAILRERGVVA